MERLGDFSIATRSRAKKDRACQRAGSTRHRKTARGVVRRTARPRPRTLVFIDETWATTKMARRYGRAPRGQRLRMGCPTAIGKQRLSRRLRLTGMTAPMVLDGPINGLAFRPMSIRFSSRTQARRHGHHGQSRSAQGRKRAQFNRSRGRSASVLPPYSPDFNPIENAFAKLKALLRKAAERTVEGLWTRIGEILDAFTPKECKNYFTAAGYDAT